LPAVNVSVPPVQAGVTAVGCQNCGTVGWPWAVGVAPDCGIVASWPPSIACGGGVKQLCVGTYVLPSMLL
jgi:hypothetical protein